jgi:hypothetical protein
MFEGVAMARANGLLRSHKFLALGVLLALTAVLLGTSIAMAVLGGSATTQVPVGGRTVNSVSNWTFGNFTRQGGTGSDDIIASTATATVITFPANCDLSGVTGATWAITGGTLPAPASGASASFKVVGQTLSIRWANNIDLTSSGNNLTMTVNNVGSPSQPGAAANYGVGVSINSTTTGGAPTGPVSFVGTLTPTAAFTAQATTVGSRSTTLSDSTSGAPATYTVGFTTGAAGRLAGTTGAGANTIAVTLNGGGLSAITTVALWDASNASTVTASAVRAGNLVTVTMPAGRTIPGSTAVRVSVGGITNPTPGGKTGSVTTSAESGSGALAYTIAALPTFTIAPTAGPNGTISPSTTQTVTQGNNQTFAVAGNTNYHILDVLKDGVSIGASSSVTFVNVTTNHTLSATFAPDTFTIVPSAGPNGTISPNTTQTVSLNASSTFNIQPNPGYHIADVLVDGSSVGAVPTYEFLSVSANHTISATFAINTYDIVPTAGVGGTISPSTTETVNSGSDSATFTIQATVPGYHIAEVTVDGAPQGPITEYKFSNVTQNHTIAATFALDTFTIVPEPSVNGSITPDTTQTVDYGTDASFTFTPAEGYHVADVLVDGSSIGTTDTAYTFTGVTGNHTIAVTFAINTYTIVPTAGPGGTISPDTTQTLEYNADSTIFLIAPAAGYHIADVLVNGASVGPQPAYMFLGVQENFTIEAIFAIDTFTIVPSTTGSGTITPDTTQTVDYGSDSVTFNIAPTLPGNHLVEVYVDDQPQGPITSYQFHNVQQDHTIRAVFAVDTFTIVPSTIGSGTITPDTTQTVDYGAGTSFAIAPTFGFHIVDVLVDGVTVGPVSVYDFTNVSQNHTITAIFGINLYEIVPSAGPGGTITPDTTQTVPFDSDSPTFLIAPTDPGYHIVDVLVDGSSVGAVTEYKFLNVSDNHTIEAIFAINTYNIVPTASGGGTISPDTTQTVDFGSDSVAFTFTPDANHHLVTVMVDGISVGAVPSYPFTNVQRDHTIEAVFAIDTFTIVPIAGAGGSISPSTTQTVDYGADSAVFQILPSDGYHIVEVKVDGATQGAIGSYQFTNVTDNHTISATFAIDTFTLAPSAGPNGSISPATTQTVDWGTDTMFTLLPADHYHVADVLVDGTTVGHPTSYTFTNVQQNHTIAATFAIDTFTIVPTVTGNGTISPDTTQTLDYGSDSATFTITPAANNHIVDVKVDGVTQGVITEYKFSNVTGNHTIAVTFGADSLTIAPSAGANGTISPDTTQTVAYGSDSPTFTITPASGYHIADVTVDGTTVGTPATYKFANVTQNHTIHATFSLTKQVARLSGKNRYVTAINIAQDLYPGWSGVKHLVLASGDYGHQPDALCAAGLAGAYNAPVLLMPSTSLDPDVKAAIQSMPAGLQVHIVGGTPSISNAVMNKVKALSKVKSVDRTYGTDRYGTSAAIARKMKPLLGASFPTTATITSGGDTLLDPLVASTASVSKHIPVLLVARASVPKVTNDALNSLGLTHRYIVGNSATVNEAVRTALGVDPANRISGADVREDATAFATRAKALGWLGNSVVGFAAAVPDAATGGAYMGKKNGPMLLVTGTTVPTTTSDYLTTNKADITAGYLFGGVPTVSEAVRLQLVGLIN